LWIFCAVASTHDNTEAANASISFVASLIGTVSALRAYRSGFKCFISWLASEMVEMGSRESDDCSRRFGFDGSEARHENEGMSDWRKRFQFSMANLLGAMVPLGLLLWVVNAWLWRRTLNPAEALLLALLAISSAVGTLIGGGSGFLAGLFIGFALYVLTIPLFALLLLPT
jgi:hypothetical protein